MRLLSNISEKNTKERFRILLHTDKNRVYLWIDCFDDYQKKYFMTEYLEV